MLIDPIKRIISVDSESATAVELGCDDDSATHERTVSLLEAWMSAAVCLIDADFGLLSMGPHCRERMLAVSSDGNARVLADLMGPTNWRVLKPYLERVARGEALQIQAGLNNEQRSRIELRPASIAGRGVIVVAVIASAHAENALPAKTRSLSAEGIPMAMALFDRSGALLWNNESLSALLGPENALLLDLAKPVNALARQLQPHFRDCVAGLSAEFELQWGEPIESAPWIHFRFSPETRPQPGETNIFLFCNTVDTQHTVATAVQQSEEQFRTFTDDIPEAIAFLDRERRYRYANPAFLQLSGRSREEVLGRSVEQVLGREIADSRKPFFERALAGEFVRLEARDALNGHPGWREVRYHPYRLRNGDVQGVYVASRSIDIQKRTQGALREEQARIRVLTDNLPAQISYLGTDRRYRYCNNRFLEDNGLTEREVIGRTPLEVFGPEIDAQLQIELEKVAEHGRVQFERRSAPKASESRWWRVVIVADNDEAGKPRGTYGIAYDITEVRQAQERLSQQQQWIEQFIENFPLPMSYLDPEGIYRYANRAFAHLIGRRKEGIVNTASHEVFPAEASEEMLQAFRAALQGTTLRSEHAVTLHGHVAAWIAVDWLPDRDESQSVRGMYCVTRDISQIKQAQLSYEESLRELQRAMDSVALPISHVDDQERIRFVNHTSTLWHGRRSEELIGLPLKHLMSEDDYSFARPYIQAALTGQLVQYEREMRYHDGIRRWVMLRYVPTRDEAGKVTGFYTTATDIQARKKQELALQQANWLLSAHFENTPLASFTLDADERITRWSSQAETLFGWRRDQVLERPFWDLNLLDAQQRADFFPPYEISELPQNNSRRHVAYALRQDGSQVACEWHIAALRDTRGRVTSILGLVQDVSMRVEAENRLIEIANRDTLTKLLNRNALEPTLRAFIDRGMRESSGVAVLFIDLDHFKNVNDTLGHRVGDLMLVEIAAILRRCIREHDEVARIGGDEFMVILAHGRPKAIAHETAQRIITALQEPIRVENQRLSVAASIGVAVFPDHGRTPDALLRSADLAMYKAKENGKNRFEFFSASLAQRSERRAGIKNALKLALQRDALHLYYQPRVGVADGRLVGAEALLRWTDSRLGAIGPKEFINIAEESGLIHELGLYVFRKACQQIKQWMDRGVAIGRISVNFSAHQLLVATFIDEVDLVIEETGCDPRFIEVEITETSMLFDLGVTKNVIADLKHRGMHIAIDDFGTGFSSLSHLQQLDIDTLKIDQSFIRDMLDDAGDLAITRSVISLGRGLGLAVTAEGVENERQLAALREAGCDHFQGFLFSPAVAAEDLEVLYLDNMARIAP
ncbi:MAG: PAS domain-containing protein [Burkholderiaceae bacterium]